MNIGEVAKRSGVSAKMIRHYESLGLLPAAHRTEAGYRCYGESAVRELTFIRHARELGFPLRQIEQLLLLWRNESRRSAEVRALALQQVAELEQKISQLQQMRDSLLEVVDLCHGDGSADCPILQKLATESDDKRGKTCCHGEDEK